MDAENNPLKNAPHTMEDLVREWDRPYSREQACFPNGASRVDKYWPPVNRVDNVVWRPQPGLHLPAAGRLYGGGGVERVMHCLPAKHGLKFKACNA